MITTIFFDIGGVLLTNGWDHGSRIAAARHFNLDWEEYNERHERVAKIPSPVASICRDIGLYRVRRRKRNQLFSGNVL